jgi:hypothetical protein
MASVNQQLAVSAGVAVGAFSVESAMWFHHSTELTAQDFGPGFLVVSVLAALSSWYFFRMPEDAGHQVSGRRMVVISDPTRETEAEEEAARETVTARDQRLS